MEILISGDIATVKGTKASFNVNSLNNFNAPAKKGAKRTRITKENFIETHSNACHGQDAGKVYDALFPEVKTGK